MPDGQSSKGTGKRHRADVAAAATVALVGLPQCLAYAMMAGLPPAYGLTTAAVAGFVAAIAGKNPYVVTGPTNTTGLLILAALTPWLGSNGLIRADGLAALATLTLLAGALRLLAAYAGGANLTDFIPESVLAGFTAGAGVLIAVMQLDEAFGMQGVRAGDLIGEVAEVARRFASTQFTWPAALLCAATIALIAGARRVRATLPGALIVLLAATALSAMLGWNADMGIPVVADRAVTRAGWPPGSLPTLDPGVVQSLLGPAAAIALLGTMELSIVSRTGHGRPDMKREIAAQGLANVFGAFTSAFPASASLTRSALMKLSGAQSRFAAAGAAVIIFPVVFFGTSAIGVVPQASLAGVLLITASSMIDLRRMRRMWRAARVTRGLLVVTFIATLTLPLAWAVFIGVALGIAQFLSSSRIPTVSLLEPRGDRLVVVSQKEAGPVVIIEVSGDCHFAATGTLTALTEALVPDRVRHVIVDLTHARAMRFSAMVAMETLERRVAAAGGKLHLAGVSTDFMAMLKSTGAELDATPHDPEPLRSVWRALETLDEPKP